MQNQVRIIAGKWRGRKITFPSTTHLRPTSDRVKETLFNILRPSVVGSVALDAFAGSGSLGLEALSRGAEEVFFVDNDSQTIKFLNDNTQKLGAKNCKIEFQDTLNFLSNTKVKFDIIFIDPPFSKSNLLKESLHLISKHNLIKTKGLIYIETGINQDIDLFSYSFNVIREFETKNIKSYLVESQ